MSGNVWGEITYSFPNFYGRIVEVWERMYNFMAQFIINVIIIHDGIKINPCQWKGSLSLRYNMDNRPKISLNWNLAKSLSTITSKFVDESFWGLAQVTASIHIVTLRKTNFRLIRNLGFWAIDILLDVSIRHGILVVI